VNFAKVSSKVEFGQLDQEVLAFWREQHIFEASLQLRAGAPRFVFYEGPPTANGLPGFHHIVARAYKDLFPRYKTMRGFLVERKAGWDAHGLPVEIEVEKALGISGKQDIERYGIERFNQRCRESVFEYIDEWRKTTERIGMWLDLDSAYVTYASSYIESVWWILKQIWDKGLLYQGYKVLPYCPRCMTPLSSHEVSLGYEDNVKDPSVYVKFELEDEPKTYFLAWTTTPWTLPGNVALAVGPKIAYVKVRQGDEQYILARDRLSVLEGPYDVVEEVATAQLLGKRYRPLYPYLPPDKPAFFVVDADFVSTSDGTGIVHTAAAYGEDDLTLCQAKGIPVRHTVDLRGRFLPEVELVAGMFVKDADPVIIGDLKRRGLMYKAETIRHTYPFCWRCTTPLLYYALTAWFIKMTAVKPALIRSNEQVNWVPEHIKRGRMGNWLETLVDWSLSRSRYWGTPLPIWVCESCAAQRCIGSVAELGLTLKDDLHRPFVDTVTLKCERCGGVMRRVPEVIDCWFDSGAMPVAQWHYPFENEQAFRDHFPADFIAEAIDQTRGWFYTLLAISTLLFDQAPYRNVVVPSHVVDKDGKKMSKSIGNVIEPTELLDRFGADAVRWYFFASVTLGTEYRASLGAVQEVVRKFLLTLWNTYSFFVTYATVDGFDPARPPVPPARRGVLDRWVLALLHGTLAEVVREMEAYDATGAARALEGFVNELSTWYVRRSRRRFWKSATDQDKLAAYQTLYEVLVTLTQALAPFTPFVSEAIFRNLKAGRDGAPLSVHLCDYPLSDPAYLDPGLLDEMARARRVVEAGHAAREAARIKVRQPLASATLTERPFAPEIEAIVRDELNLKAVTYVAEDAPTKVVLDTTLTAELRQEGLARELVRKIQELRREATFEVDDRIHLSYQGAGALTEALAAWSEYIRAETLAVSVTSKRAAEAYGKEVQIGGEAIWLGVKRATQ
jgi:isoleucyl-tRNA synthetase